MHLFWSKGYAATGMSELLDAMGIARKSLYDTFGNKRQLFIQALSLYARQELGRVEAELASDRDSMENIERVLRRWQSMNSKPESRGCMLGNNTAHFTSDDEEMLALLKSYYTGLEKAFVAALKRAQEEGDVSPSTSVKDLARMLVATAQGLALVTRTHRDGSFARGVVRAALAALEAA